MLKDFFLVKKIIHKMLNIQKAYFSKKLLVHALFSKKISENLLGANFKLNMGVQRFEICHRFKRG